MWIWKICWNAGFRRLSEFTQMNNNNTDVSNNTDVYSEPIQTSKMKLFEKIVNIWSQPHNITKIIHCMNPCLNGFLIRPCNNIYGFYTIHIHEYTSQIASRFFVRCTLFLQEILNGFELNTISFQRTPTLLKKKFTWDLVIWIFSYLQSKYLRKAMNKNFSWNLNLTLVWWKKTMVISRRFKKFY